MAPDTEIGNLEDHSWRQRSMKYFDGLPEEPKTKWKAILLASDMDSLGKDLKDICEFRKESLSDSFPRVWEMEISALEKGVVSERTFDSLDGFPNYIKTSPLLPGYMRIILFTSDYDRYNRELYRDLRRDRRFRYASYGPRKGIAEWMVTITNLAYLGCLWGIAEETLFPSGGSWREDRENGLKIRGEKRWSNLVESLALPSDRLSAMMNVTPLSDNTSIIETLFLPMASSFLFDGSIKDLLYVSMKQPFYNSLRLTRVSRLDNNNRRAENFIIVSDLKGFRDYLKKHLSSGGGGSLKTFQNSTGDMGPISFVRSIRQFVIHRLCKTLDSLKIGLEEAKYISRREPSYNILDFISILQDNLEMTRLFLEYVGKEFPTLKDLDVLDAEDLWPDSFRKDREYLDKEIENLEKNSKAVQETVKTHIGKKNGSRNTVFAILASLYLPFSLATGVFGMNIREINGATPQWFTVLALGLPMAVVTVAIPLTYNYFYSKSLEFQLMNKALFRLIIGGTIVIVGLGLIVTPLIIFLGIRSRIDG